MNVLALYRRRRRRP